MTESVRQTWAVHEVLSWKMEVYAEEEIEKEQGEGRRRKSK